MHRNLCVARNFEKNNKTFVPRDENNQVWATALYIHGYILWFPYPFKVCLKSVSEIWYIRPVIVVGAVIMHKMFETLTKHLSATDGQLKVFQGPCGWRSSIFKSPLCTLFTSVTMLTHQNKLQIQLTNGKALNVFYIYFFGQWFVEIKLKKLSILTCEYCEQFCYKLLVQNGGYFLF